MWRFPLAPYFSQVLLALFALFALFKDWNAYGRIIPLKSSSRGRHLFPIMIGCLIFVLTVFNLTNVHDSRIATARDRDTIGSLARQIDQSREENRYSATSVSNFQVQLELVDLSQVALEDFYGSIPRLSSFQADESGFALLNAMDTAAKRVFFSRAFTFRSAQTKEQFLGGFTLRFSDTPPLAIQFAPCAKAADGKCEPKVGLMTPSTPIFPTTFHVSNQDLTRSGKDGASWILHQPGSVSRSTSHNITARMNFNPLALQRLREITGTLSLTTFQSVPSLSFGANPESVALSHKMSPLKTKTVHDGQQDRAIADIPDDVLEAAIATVPRRVNVSFTYNLSDDL